MASGAETGAPSSGRRAGRPRTVLAISLCLLLGPVLGGAPSSPERGPRLLPLPSGPSPDRGRIAPRRRASAAAVRAGLLDPEQAEALQRLRARHGRELDVRFRRGSDTPRQIKGRSLERPHRGRPGRRRDRATARGFLRAQRALLRLDDPDRELRLTGERRDGRGRRHLRYAQVHEGLPVWPAELRVHLESDGSVFLLNGSFVATPDLATEPELAAADAASRARARVPGGEAASVRPPELIVYAPGDAAPRLAWRVDLEVDLASSWRVVVDALNAELLLAHNRTPRGAASGSGLDVHGMSRPLALWEEAGTYHLVDTSKPLMYDPTSTPPTPSATRGAIIVMDAANLPASSTPTSLPALAQVTSVDPNLWALPDGVSAAFNLSESYDYFLECHSRTQFDDGGASLLGVVRLGSGFPGAFYASALSLIAFGDGDLHVGSTDIVGHEYTHGIIEATADFVYANQSGAVSEAFADILGELIEAHAVASDADCANDPDPDWLVGSSLLAPVRDLQDPSSLLMGTTGLPYPTSMSEFIAVDDPLLDSFPDRDNGGVHLNAVIVGRAFQLLASELPQAIGLAPAATIFYRALRDHLVANSQFIDVRLACIAEAESGYGVGSPEALATALAFDTVEIFDGPSTPEPPDYAAVLAQDSTVYISFEGGSGLFFLDRRETLLGDPAGGSPLSLFDVSRIRPAVRGDGERVWFIDSQDAVCTIDTNPTVAESCTDRVGPPAVAPAKSIAVSPDGSLLATVFDATPTNVVTIADISPGGGGASTPFTLEAPTVDGQPIANLLFADVMEFTADNQFLIFDALNELPLAGEASVFVWSIYALELSTEIVFTVVPPLQGFDFDYPALGQTNDNYITFDAVEQVTGVSTVFAGNLTTGELVPVATLPFAAGVPGYTGDDSAIVYTLVQSGSTDLMRQELEADHVTPTAAPPTLWLAAGDFGVIYRRGDWDGPAPDRDLDGIADFEDNCRDEPNSGQEDIGGLGPASTPDGIGDACQCTDVDRDGRVTDQDADDMRAHLLGNTPAGFALQLCSGIGSLECDLLDVAVTIRALAGELPGIQQVCAAVVP